MIRITDLEALEIHRLGRKERKSLLHKYLAVLANFAVNKPYCVHLSILTTDFG